MSKINQILNRIKVIFLYVIWDITYTISEFCLKSISHTLNKESEKNENE